MQKVPVVVGGSRWKLINLIQILYQGGGRGREGRYNENFSSINHGANSFCRIITAAEKKVFNQPDDETIMDNFINEIIVL